MVNPGPRAAVCPPTLFEQLRPLYDAIRAEESRGGVKPGKDGERGPYQIKADYWREGCKRGGVKWSFYGDGPLDPAKCEYVMYHYWRRYCPAALAELDFETLARAHNGGPDGARQACTLDYWRRVKDKLEIRHGT